MVAHVHAISFRLLVTWFSLIPPVEIIKVLGEGGFSFVYLAQDEHSGVSDT